MIYYFAYGSNLHPVRLQERVASARLITKTQLKSHQLVFHKLSTDGSSKCGIQQTANQAEVVFGAIYEIAEEHKNLLDSFEGNGVGYTDKFIKLNYQGMELSCFTYYAQVSHIVEGISPYHWYKGMVIEGARYLGFPRDYLAKIESVDSVQDPDQNRRRQQEMLLEKMINFQY